jgi:hypothetical protein
MKTRKRFPSLMLVCLVLGGCRGASSDEAPAAPAPAMLPKIVLDAGPGITAGTPVIARGIVIGTVESTTLEQRQVIVTARLDAGHQPTLGEGACVRISREVEAVALELELGRGDAAPEQLERCADPEEPAAATSQPSAIEPPTDPESEPEAEAEAEANNEPSSAAKPKPAKRSCGDDLSFSTLSVDEVGPIALHLPTGGWRAKIRFTNDGDGFVEIDGAQSAAFMDASGAALDVATLPASKDWFMPFQLPPRSSKEVTVTFHQDGGAKPWVERIKYTWFCD